MNKKITSKILLLSLISLLFTGSVPQKVSARASGGNPATDCIINSFYQVNGTTGSGTPFQNYRMHFWLSPLCTGANITAPVGNTTPTVHLTAVTDASGNKYGYADTTVADVFNGTYTLTASGPTTATASLYYSSVGSAACSLAWTNVFLQPINVPAINWSASGCSGLRISFNNVVNNSGSASLQPGINTLKAEAFNSVTAQYYVVDYVDYDKGFGGPGGPGGPGGGNANIDVNSVGCSTSGLSWVINPGSLVGSGSAGSYTVSPGSGTTYTITPSVTSGTFSVTNSDAGGTSMVLDQGDDKSFDISCVPAPTATVSVVSNLSSAGWTINPGSSVGTGNGSVVVTPGSSGTVYTITPATVAGYVSPFVSPGTSQLVGPGSRVIFNITYSPIGAPLNFSLSTNPSFFVTQGSSIQIPVTSRLLSGSAEPVSFFATGYNASDITSVSYAPQPCPTPDCVENVTLQVSPTATLGVKHITVSGTSAPSSIKRSTSFNLDIIPASNLSVTCSASPSPALVGQPVTWTSVVTGSVGPTTYAWSGTNFPSGVNTPTTAQYTIVYQTVGTKSASVTATDNGSARTASCPNTTLEVQVNPNFKEF